jgi:hypothetical protein
VKKPFAMKSTLLGTQLVVYLAGFLELRGIRLFYLTPLVVVMEGTPNASRFRQGSAWVMILKPS